MEQIYELAEMHMPEFLAQSANQHGVSVIRAEFAGEIELTAFMLDLIGNPIMRGHASKAIGNSLLIWKR